MTWIDYTIIALIIFSCLTSSIHGFIREFLSLTTWSCTFFITIHYYSFLSAWFIPFEGDKLIRDCISIVILFITTLIFGSFINYIIHQVIKKTGLSGVDRILGFFFGIFRGVFIISIILFFLDTFIGLSETEDWQKSQLIQKFNLILRWFLTFY